ncbi:unnamed protein product [Hermetia illucens]|uniref:Uncharacterized protein n=1 Tax=Hermetia illucens TaxID=343691 RepID=A0A7R8UIS3_HERIL|nr:unnamed protein product [Hermetia illucens]
MKFIVAIVFALIAVVAADVSHLGASANDFSSSASGSVNREYLPPFQGDHQGSASVNREYLPPFQSDASEPAPAHTFGADGYKYKTPTRFFRF